MESVSFHLCFGQLNPRKKLLKTWKITEERGPAGQHSKKISGNLFIMWESVKNPCFVEINSRIKPFKSLENYFSGQKIRQTLFQAFISTARREGQHATKISGELYYRKRIN